MASRYGSQMASTPHVVSGATALRRLVTAAAAAATLLALLVVPAAQADGQCGELASLASFTTVFVDAAVAEKTNSGVTVTVTEEEEAGTSAFQWTSAAFIAEVVVTTDNGEQVTAAEAHEGEIRVAEGSHITSAEFCVRTHKLTIRALDVVNEAPVAGAAFDVLADEGSGTFTPDSDERVGGCTTGEDGTCSVADLIPGGYWVATASTPDDFEVLEDTLKVDIVDGPVTVPASLEFADQRHVFLQLTTHDSGTAPLLEGAEFQLTRSGKRPDEDLRATCVTTAEGLCLFVDPQGRPQHLSEAELFDIWRAEPAPKELPVGRVRIDTNDGDQVIAGAEPITLFTGTTRQAAPQDLDRGDDIRDVLIGVTAINLTLTHSDLTLVATAEGRPDSRLDGADFALWIDRDGNGLLDRDTDVDAGRACTTGAEDEAGRCAFSGLPLGDYLLVQTASPSDVPAVEDRVTPVTVGQRDGTVTVINPPPPASLKVTTEVSVDGGASWLEADSSPAPLLDADDLVAFRVTVMNTGGRRATDLSLSGHGLALTDCDVPASLNPGALFTCGSGSSPADPGQHRARVTATADGTSDRDPAHYFGVTPALNLNVAADRTTARPGDTIAYTYRLTNPGNVRLSELRLTDDLLGAITLPATALDPGDSLTATATYVVTEPDAEAGQVTTFATASGQPPAGPSKAAADGSLVTSSTPACPANGVAEDHFADVPADDVHEAAIDCLAWWQVTRGTGDGYGPALSVSRAQMASFIVRLLETAGATLSADGDPFTDDDGSPHEPAIDKLAEAGVVRGVSADRYDPHGPITRAQMASFLVRAYPLASKDLPKATTDHFTDDDGSVHEPNINQAVESGLAHGTKPDAYEPNRPVRRDQMASFLTRVMDRMRRDARISVTP